MTVGARQCILKRAVIMASRECCPSCVGEKKGYGVQRWYLIMIADIRLRLRLSLQQFPHSKKAPLTARLYKYFGTYR